MNYILANMLDHTTLPVSDYADTKTKYDAVFAAINIPCLHAGEQFAGYGVEHPVFWICEPFDDRGPSKNAHIAMAVGSKELVHKFHEAALAQGWKDNGAPGARSEYGENYYAAFVLDQDGNNIEAVYRGA